MAKLIAYYSRAGENEFGGAYRYDADGNTEKAAKILAELTGGDLFKIEGSGLSHTEQDIAGAAKGAKVAPGLSIHGSTVDDAEPALAAWVRENGSGGRFA